MRFATAAAKWLHVAHKATAKCQHEIYEGVLVSKSTKAILRGAANFRCNLLLGNWEHIKYILI